MFVYKIKLQRKISTNQRADICMCSWTVRNVCFCTFKRAFNFQRPETGNFDSCICSAVVSKCYFITFAVMSTWFCVHCDPGLKTRDLKLDFVRFLLAPEKKRKFCCCEVCETIRTESARSLRSFRKRCCWRSGKTCCSVWAQLSSRTFSSF